MSEPDPKSEMRNPKSRSGPMSTTESPEISIIVPVYNEAPNLQTLVEDTLEVMRAMGRLFELILIDDGSTDNSHELLRTIKKQYPRTVCHFSTPKFWPERCHDRRVRSCAGPHRCHHGWRPSKTTRKNIPPTDFKIRGRI